MNEKVEIRCPCCNELITIDVNPLQVTKSDEKEIIKILNDLNVEFG